MKKILIVFGLLMSMSTYAYENTAVNELTPTPLTEVSAESLNTFNQLLLDGSIKELTTSINEDESCTVALSANIYGIEFTVSVTADTCAEAGAGALDALAGFYSRAKDFIKLMKEE